MNNKDIEEVYKRYGYLTRNIDGVLVCEYKQGRYFGVDIIRNGNSEKIEKIESGYKKSNFATNVKKYDNIEEIEDELFKSFFQLSAFRTNINRKYEAFVKKQMTGLPKTAKYKYINSDYSFSNYDSEGIMTGSTEIENQPVVDKVSELLNTATKPVFVIIEAAAGYGKTCTAYEIIKQMEEKNTEILPFYIELSRNREARIFKHILQNEIDEQFQNVVKSDVVLHQIKQGKIPVIIDGFDELLSKDLSANASQLRDIESMLSTIVNLLEGKAKIVITSRKTAIFSGEDFYEWIKNTNQKYSVARFSISEPKIENWLEKDRLDILNNCNFPVANVANPVLLSYIRNIEIEELQDLIQNSKSIVDKYFERLLEREKERQNIYINEEIQLRIFKKLVRIMSEFDIKADNKSFIKDIIKDYNKKIFDDYIKNYAPTPKPTHDELADTLSNHALLDRKQHDNVGFINEFIFGILIGRNLIEEKYQEHYPNNFTTIITQDFAYLAISAFKVQPQERQEQLWKILHENKFPYDTKFCFYRDLYLKNDFVDNYNDILIEELSFSKMNFTKDGQFQNSIISNCKFDDCTFDKNAFDNSGFINCKFFNCQWTDNACHNSNNLYITGCESNNGFENKLYEHEEQSEIQVNVEELILRKFVKSISKVNSMRRLSQIRNSLREQKIGLQNIENAITSLKKSGYIVINGDNCFIQREGITYFNRTYIYE
ncbi:MAG: hypothetical protein LBC68_11235 [Prevotellaceae bacterium]|jgi:hypothetical protein|nr:hypothetical protein [Prevotellaceae bacterium]